MTPRLKRLLTILVLCIIGFCVRLRPERVLSYLCSEKREGDLLFQSLPHGELVDAIEGISQSEWSHCGILIKRDGNWMVAEAIGEVRETPLWAWLIRGRGSKVAAFRSSAFQPGDVEKLRTEIGRMMGLPYDYSYAPGDDSIYCSELISKAFERASKIRLGKWESLGSLNWKPFETFIRNTEAGELPLNRMMVTPVSITRDAGVARVN